MIIILNMEVMMMITMTIIIIARNEFFMWSHGHHLKMMTI